MKRLIMKEVFEFAKSLDWKLVSVNQFQKLVKIKKKNFEIDIWNRPRNNITVVFREQGIETVRRRNVSEMDLREVVKNISYVYKI